MIIWFSNKQPSCSKLSVITFYLKKRRPKDRHGKRQLKSFNMIIFLGVEKSTAEETK